MTGQWQIFDHHLAVEYNGSILHPTAQEVYQCLSPEKSSYSINGINCPNPKISFSELRFSSIGCPIVASITSDEHGIIRLSVGAKRRGQIIPLDLSNGTIIDHAISDNTWFFVSGPIGDIQGLITSANIQNLGVISVKQYLKILESEMFNGTSFIEKNVDVSSLKTPVNNSEEAPTSLKAKLFPYQKTGYLWIKYMLEESQGCILGDEMGLGKTMQVIASMLHLKSNGLVPMLVVAPISLLANWQRECSKFAPSLKVHIHHGHNRISYYKHFLEYDVVVTSYATLVSDISMLNMIQWQLVALDEAQNIKNPYSARTKACKSVNRVRSIAVSGTPFENHVTDIWSLVDFALPGFIGALSQYNNHISDDIEGGRKIEPILSPLMIRRLVKDVAKDLPEKIVSTQPISMSDEEAAEYIKYQQDILKSIDQDNVNLGALQKLRLYCTHPFTVNELTSSVDPYKASLKYQRFCEIVEEVISRKEKVIVFTSFKKMFDIFTDDIPYRFGIKVWTINGETPVDTRQEIVDIFNATDGSAMLVLNPKAAGTGLNITGANHVIHYNLEWNPSLEDQSSARSYRRGQEKTVFIYRLFYMNTVEQIVNERIERKRDIAQEAIVGNTGVNQDRADIIAALNLIPEIRS